MRRLNTKKSSNNRIKRFLEKSGLKKNITAKSCRKSELHCKISAEIRHFPLQSTAERNQAQRAHYVCIVSKFTYARLRYYTHFLPGLPVSWRGKSGMEQEGEAAPPFSTRSGRIFVSVLSVPSVTGQTVQSTR